MVDDWKIILITSLLWLIKLILLTPTYSYSGIYIVWDIFKCPCLWKLGIEKKGSTVYMLLAHMFTRMWHFMSLSRTSVRRQFCIGIYIVSFGITSCVGHQYSNKFPKPAPFALTLTVNIYQILSLHTGIRRYF